MPSNPMRTHEDGALPRKKSPGTAARGSESRRLIGAQYRQLFAIVDDHLPRGTVDRLRDYVVGTH